MNYLVFAVHRLLRLWTLASLRDQLNRLKLAEKERDSLEGARNEAEEFLRLDAAIREKLNVLYQTMVAHAAANVENVRHSPLKPFGVFLVFLKYAIFFEAITRLNWSIFFVYCILKNRVILSPFLGIYFFRFVKP